MARPRKTPINTQDVGAHTIPPNTEISPPIYEEKHTTEPIQQPEPEPEQQPATEQAEIVTVETLKAVLQTISAQVNTAIKAVDDRNVERINQMSADILQRLNQIGQPPQQPQQAQTGSLKDDLIMELVQTVKQKLAEDDKPKQSAPNTMQFPVMDLQKMIYTQAMEQLNLGNMITQAVKKKLMNQTVSEIMESSQHGV